MENNKIEPTLELAGRVIDELRAENKLLLESLKKVVRAAQGMPLYFTDPKFKSLYTKTEKAKETIKKLQHG